MFVLQKIPEVVSICKKCISPKPPRSHHCSVCNKCVLKMDHHCRILMSMNLIIVYQLYLSSRLCITDNLHKLGGHH